MDCLLLALRVRSVALTAVICCGGGCLLSPEIAHNAGSEFAPPVAPDPNHADALKAPGTASPTPAELTAAMAEVHHLGQSDPAVQQALVDDLRRTDPSLWPQLVNAYRTSLAYRQQSSERIARLAQQNSPQNNPHAAANSTVSPAVTPAGATSELVPQVQSLQNAIYPTTSTPFETQLPPASADSLQPPNLQSLHAAIDGAILAPVQPADLSANYPTTRYPEVRFTAAEMTPASPTSDDWQSQLTATIRAMESRTAASANSSPSAADQAILRMLYLAAGRRDDALQPLTGVSSAEQDFWCKELAGLASMFDEQDGRDASRRTAEAARQLQQAAAKLAQATPLVVRNLAFCTEVSSFGVYKPLATQTFKPGQQLLLYAELDNFISEATEKGYRTSLSSRYELLDSRGNRIAGEEFGRTEELCRNVRRDFFVRYFLKLPKPLATGQYSLQLMVEDTAAAKTARGQIQFSVAE